MIKPWLFVPDTHAPFHDVRAWKLMLQVGRKLRPYGIAHMGDLGDFYSVSAHSKDPSRKLTLLDEMAVAAQCRADLDELGATDKRFIEGNHEYRLNTYIADKAPELAGITSADDLLGLTAHGWNVTPYRDYTSVGALNLTHDTGQGGKYTAARATETFQASVAIGHHHAIQYFVMGDARGDRQLGVSFGWLGDLNAIDYMHRIKVMRTWALGCGVGYHDTRSGVVYVVPIPFVNYTCLFNGEVLRQR